MLTLEPRDVQFLGLDGHGVSLQAAVAPSTLGKGYSHACNRRQNSAFLEPDGSEGSFCGGGHFYSAGQSSQSTNASYASSEPARIQLVVLASSSGGLQLYKEGAHEDTYIQHHKALCKSMQKCMKMD